MLENSPAGLHLLDPVVTVTVTGDEHHQPVLSRYPATPGLARRVAVELRWRTPDRRTIEVLLDGARVGELTHALSDRYAPAIDPLLALGARPGCEATIVRGRRGLRLELHLPATPQPPTLAVPAPLPTKSKRGKVPLAFAGTVTAMVAVIATLATTGDDTPTADTGTTITTTALPSPTTRPTSTRPTPVRPTTTRPPTTTPLAPEPTEAPPPQTPDQDCNPNYTPCVPNDPVDVDCANGNGNGPSYVEGPVRVIGTDVYDLDRDKNGIGCQ
ncbi:hypothetical protein [Actinokineospora sp. NPDC004072]